MFYRAEYSMSLVRKGHLKIYKAFEFVAMNAKRKELKKRL